jgi:hypothetical protein
MVTFDTSQIINIAGFAYAWRITDPKWDKLPNAVLRQLKPLSEAASRVVDEKSMSLRRRGPFIVCEENYRIVSDCSLVDAEPHEVQRIRSWFLGLPIESSEQIYVHWANVEPTTTIVTEWATFREVWDSLWYPFDALDVFDDTLAWAVLMEQEEQALYVEKTHS